MNLTAPLKSVCHHERVKLTHQTCCSLRDAYNAFLFRVR